MAVGFGDWDPNLHPRGWHGRFIKKFKLAPWLDRVLKASRVRTFQTDSQAAQFNFNAAHVQNGGAFSELDFRRIRMDWDEAADHIRAGDIDPTTKQWQDLVNSRMTPTKEGLIVGRTFTPEALGLSPQQLNENDPNGIIRLTGNTITDKAPSPVHLGSDMSHGAGKITMRIAVPEGVPVAHLGENRNDRGLMLGGDQKLLVTRVYPDGAGGWYMTAVAEPPGSTTGNPVHAITGRKGANLTPDQREARIGAPSVMRQPAEPPSAPPRQVDIAPDYQQPGVRSVEPGPPQAQTPARQAARAARRAGYKQAVANEQQQINEPQPVAAPPPQAVTPTPSPAPPAGVGERTEPVHAPIGGTPTGGRSASEIASTPPEPAPAPAAPAAPTVSPATFKKEFQDRGLQSPSAGAQRREFNEAYQGVITGRKDPADALRDLDADVERNKRNVEMMKSQNGKPEKIAELEENAKRQEKLADLIAEHTGAPRGHKAVEPGTPAEGPDTSAPAPAKAAFKSVKELTPAERTQYDTLSQGDRSKYLARRRAGRSHGESIAAIRGENRAESPRPVARAAKAAEPPPAPEKPKPTSQTEKNAAAAARRAETGEQKPTVNPVQMKPGDKVLVRKNAAGEWERTTTKTGATPLTVERVELGRMASQGGRTRNAYILHGTGPDGERIQTTAHAGNTAFKRHEEKAPRKAATKAAKATAPEAPAAPGLTESQKELRRKAGLPEEAKISRRVPNDVQQRAAEAGLPNTVTALRSAAREQKIRGFSTMNKEQLQRALLGEEVGTGGKLGAISPEKLTPHLVEAKSGQEANALLEEHTVADLKALAKHNGVDLKGITTKDRIKDAILKDLRGPEGAALRPEKPLHSLDEEIKGIKVPDNGQSIVDNVDPNDPDSLRNASDELERLAKEADNPTDAGRLQNLSDRMGMRAQVLSGVEAQVPAKKATKAVAKAAPVKKLSVHQERVRKQHIADGMDEAEARQLAEEAPVRAPAGTKATTAKRIAERKAASLPGPRGEGEPGPKLSAPKRAAKVAPTPVARENLGGPANRPGEGNLGPNLTPEEKIQALGPGGRTTPRPSKLSEAEVERRLVRGKIRSQDLRPGDRVMVERDSEGQIVPEMVRGDKAAFPVDVVKQNDDGSVRVRDGAGNEMDTVGPREWRGPNNETVTGKVTATYRPETPTEARRAAKEAAAPGEQGTRGRSRAEVLQQSKIGGAQRAPDDAEIKRVIRDLDNPISREEAHGLLQGLTKNRLLTQAEGLDIPGAKSMTKDRLRESIVETTVGRRIDSVANRGFTDVSPGMAGQPAPAKVAKEAVAQAEKAHPDVPKPAVKATRAKVAKDIPDGSVGTRGSEPIDNSARFNEFQQGWNKAMQKVPIPDKTSQGSLDEIHKDVGSGKITPEEGIRRLESDISLNQDEINDINRTIRAGNLTDAETNDLRTKRDKLITSVAGQETASRFMHEHFGKERVTVPEVLDQVKEAQGQKWWDGLNKEDPSEFRRIMKEETGLDLKGSNAQEIFQDALKQTIQKGLSDRAAAKEARNAQKAAREAAKAKAVEEFSPGGAKHLDANAIAGDLNVDKNVLERAQNDLNSGKTPGQVAKDLERTAELRATTNVYQNGGWHVDRDSHGMLYSPEEIAQRKAEQEAKFQEEDAKIQPIRELANRLKTTRRPTVRKATAAKATEDLAEAKKAVKEPAAKKAVARAEASVKEAGQEAEALKARIIDRHQKAWDASTTRQEAEAAAANMRQDLLLSEIRDWAKPMGITGRSKDDILKKAVERRFGSGGDILTGEPGVRPAVAKVNSRMEEGNRVKNIGAALSDVDELLGNKASERALRQRASTSKLAKENPDLAKRIEEAAVSGDTAELDRIASEQGLTRNTGPVGSIEPFEPGKHRGLGESHPRKGAAVRVFSPGYQGTVEGRAFQAHPAGVLEASPEERQSMLERLGQERREAIAGLPAETRAAVIARSARQRENNPKLGVAKAAPAKKAVPAPAPLPTNREEEVAGNMARLNAAKAAKAAKAAAPEAKAPREPSPSSGRLSRTQLVEELGKATSTAEGSKLIAIHLPQSKAQYRALAEKVGVETGPRDTMAHMHDAILRQTVTRRLEHAAYLRRANPATSTGAAERGKLEMEGLDKGAVRSAGFHDFSSKIRAQTGRGDDLKLPNGGQDQGLLHMDSSIGNLWQDLAADNRVPTSTVNEVVDIGHNLGTGKINLPTARAAIRDLKTDNAAVRERINKAVADLEVKPSKIDVPDNTPQAVKDWLRNIDEIPAFHNKAPNTRGSSGPTPFEKAVELVRDIGNGDEGPGGDMKLTAVGHNVHESGDGVYQARREGDHLFTPGSSKMTPEVRDWLRSYRNKPGETVSANDVSKALHEAHTKSIKVDAVKARANEINTPGAKKLAAQYERGLLTDDDIQRELDNEARTAAHGSSPEVSPPRNADRTGLPSHEEAQSRARQAAAAPRKATKAAPAKKAAKAAPAVTKAEQRNPVAKVGTEAPKAPEANVTAHGLTPGEGVPVSTFLALQNKLGSGKSTDLRALDRHARIPGDYNKVPDLYRKILQQLQTAGVGPDDPVRKNFEKWFKDHFS